MLFDMMENSGDLQRLADMEDRQSVTFLCITCLPYRPGSHFHFWLKLASLLPNLDRVIIDLDDLEGRHYGPRDPLAVFDLAGPATLLAISKEKIKSVVIQFLENGSFVNLDSLATAMEMMEGIQYFNINGRPFGISVSSLHEIVCGAASTATLEFMRMVSLPGCFSSTITPPSLNRLEFSHMQIDALSLLHVFSECQGLREFEIRNCRVSYPSNDDEEKRVINDRMNRAISLHPRLSKMRTLDSQAPCLNMCAAMASPEMKSWKYSGPAFPPAKVEEMSRLLRSDRCKLEKLWFDIPSQCGWQSIVSSAARSPQMKKVDISCQDFPQWNESINNVMREVSDGNQIQTLFLRNKYDGERFDIDHLNPKDVVKWVETNYALIELNLRGQENLIDFINSIAKMNRLGRGYIKTKNTKENAVAFLAKVMGDYCETPEDSCDCDAIDDSCDDNVIKDSCDDSIVLSAIFFHIRENANTFCN